MTGAGWSNVSYDNKTGSVTADWTTPSVLETPLHAAAIWSRKLAQDKHEAQVHADLKLLAPRKDLMSVEIKCPVEWPEGKTVIKSLMAAWGWTFEKDVHVTTRYNSGRREEYEPCDPYWDVHFVNKTWVYVDVKR